MTYKNCIYLQVSDLEQMEIKKEFTNTDILKFYFRIFDSRRGCKRGFKIVMTKELFEQLAVDIYEGDEYPEVSPFLNTYSYRNLPHKDEEDKTDKNE